MISRTQLNVLMLAAATAAATSPALADVTYTLTTIYPNPTGVYINNNVSPPLVGQTVGVQSSAFTNPSGQQTPTSPSGISTGGYVVGLLGQITSTSANLNSISTKSVYEFDPTTKTAAIIDLGGNANTSTNAYVLTSTNPITGVTTSTSNAALATVAPIASNGIAAGTNMFYVGGVAAGQDAWVYTPATLTTPAATTAIPLPASNSLSIYSSGSTHYVYASAVTSGGTVIGAVNRYNSAGSNTGSEVYVSDGKTTTVISPEGANYQYVGNSLALINAGYVDSNDSGEVLGYSMLASTPVTGSASSTYAIWLYTGSSAGNPTVITPTATSGVTYTLPSSSLSTSGLKVNASGQVAGTWGRFDSTGTAIGKQAAFFDGTNSHNIGLTGSTYVNGATYNSVVATISASTSSGTSINQGLLSNSGVVAGYNTRYAGTSSVGQDAWIYKYNGVSADTTNYTVQVGLTAASTGVANASFYESSGTRSSTPLVVNANGQVAGSSLRYVGGTSSTNQDTWYVDARTVDATSSASGLSSTKIIGLNSDTGFTSSLFQTSAGVRYSQVTGINTVGDVVGYSNRYNSSGTKVGQDAWFYDPTAKSGAGVTYDIFSGSTAADGVTASDTIMALSNTGIAVGYYTKYDGTGTSLGNYAFMWSLATGFEDLSSEITPGLTADGWTQLAQGLSVTDTGIIYGVGVPTGDSAKSVVAFELTPNAVPEPATLGVMGIAAVGILARRKRV